MINSHVREWGERKKNWKENLKENDKVRHRTEEDGKINIAKGMQKLTLPTPGIEPGASRS